MHTSYRDWSADLTSRGLSVAAQGIAALIHGGGRMLLGASPLFDAEDLEAIREVQPRKSLGIVRAGWVRLQLDCIEDVNVQRRGSREIVSEIKTMSPAISAHFDGRAIIPDAPLELTPGQRLRIRIEKAEPEAYPLAQIADMATDMLVEDLADRHRELAHRGPEGAPND